MNTWYKDKTEFHHKQWPIATEAGKDKAAGFHMQEYQNYMELFKLSK